LRNYARGSWPIRRWMLSIGKRSFKD